MPGTAAEAVRPACAVATGPASPARPSLLRIGLRDWRRIALRTATAVISDRVSMAAAGCAFYGTLALFPAISMVIFLCGLLFDPRTVEPQLQTLRQLLPPEAFALITQRVHVLASHRHGTLSFGLALSTVITVWSSMTGTKAVLSALTVAFDQTEARGFLRFQLVAMAMTLSAIVGAVLALAILVALPWFIHLIGLSQYQQALVRDAGIGLLLAYLLASLSLLYRFGPSRANPQFHWVTPGSLLATVLWLLASSLFSFYVGHIASYDALYGPIAAVVGVMMWFWVSVFVVLLGAELDAALEQFGANEERIGAPVSSTTDPP